MTCDILRLSTSCDYCLYFEFLGVSQTCGTVRKHFLAGQFNEEIFLLVRDSQRALLLIFLWHEQTQPSSGLHRCNGVGVCCCCKLYCHCRCLHTCYRYAHAFATAESYHFVEIDIRMSRCKFIFSRVRALQELPD